MAESQLDRTYFVSPDARLRGLSERLGAVAIAEPKGLGPNAAVSLASRRAAEDGAAATLVLFSDLPLVRREDVDRLISMATQLGEGAVATRSTRGGTNALWRKPPDVIVHRYGENSFINHETEAREAGVPFLEFRCERISLDMDTPEDLDLLLKREDVPERYAFLSRLGETGTV
jgi:2-phospho-L-lactate guanylyltransferase